MTIVVAGWMVLTIVAYQVILLAIVYFLWGRVSKLSDMRAEVDLWRIGMAAQAAYIAENVPNVGTLNQIKAELHDHLQMHNAREMHETGTLNPSLGPFSPMEGIES